MIKFRFLLLIPLFVFAFTACEEEDQTSIGTPAEEDLQPIQDNTKAEQGVMNSANLMNPYGLDEDLSGKKAFDENPEYSISNDSLQVTIDFSAVDNMDGEIIITYNTIPLYDFSQISATAELINYTQGTIVYNGLLNFSMTIGDVITMTVATPDGEEITIQDGNLESTWIGERVMTWTEGFDTPAIASDDIYEVSGSARGITSNQTNYTAEILETLVFSPDCDYIMYGEQQIKNYVGTDNETTLTLTYHVDSGGNTLTEPTCNSYFNLNFVSQNLELNLVLSFNDM